MNNYEDIKEGEKKQISKSIREIDGVKYSEYTYITKLPGGKIHKQIVKSKYVGKKKDAINNYNIQPKMKISNVIVKNKEKKEGKNDNR